MSPGLARPPPPCRHRGSGASKVSGHSVRENTLLSFQKAAINHSDFIEFDVHVTAGGRCWLAGAVGCGGQGVGGSGAGQLALTCSGPPFCMPPASCTT